MNKAIATGILIGLLGGCVEQANVSEMVPDASAVTPDLKSPIRNGILLGTITGGANTNPNWSSHVDNTSFAAALKSALTENELAATTTPRYRLDVWLRDLRQPSIGFDMTVRTTVRYTVTDVTLKKVVFDRQIADNFTATEGDAFFAGKRLEIANEGSIKANIADLVNQLIMASLTWPTATR
jgi:hypothetical protein